MTKKELIKTLSEFPDEAPVNFCLFSNLTPKRCDVHDNHLMIKYSPHTKEINIMLDLEEYWEKEITNSIKSQLIKIPFNSTD